MFYLLKHLLLLMLVIFKPKCINLTFNDILLLYALSVCLLHSHFVENHLIWILEEGLLISEVVLSHRQVEKSYLPTSIVMSKSEGVDCSRVLFFFGLVAYPLQLGVVGL
jgi:hypothetical protein